MKWIAAAALMFPLVASAQPAPRYSVAAAFDPVRRELVTFGGRTNDGADSSETWRWNGAAWNRYEGPAPSARNGAAMTWDGQRILLFGGVRGQQPLGDTWAWDGERWTEIATTGPSARTLAGLAHDSRRGRVVLFGGLSGSTPRGDTWEWDGATWIARDVGNPPARSLHGLAYDEARGVVVLFAGNSGLGPSTILGDTWMYDGTSWIEASPTRPRDHVAMAWSPALQRVAVFGGYDGDQTNETLEWDGARWLVSPATGVTPRLFAVLNADVAGGRMLLFGGFAISPFNELWSFDCDRWQRLSP